MIEQVIQQKMASAQNEKSFIDKLLSKNDIEKVRQLVKKEKLTRSELLDLLYMCLSSESKLVNYSEWDRYVILKFFVWIREMIKIAEMMYDYQEKMEQKEKEGKIKMSDRTKQLFDKNQRLIEHNAKFLVDLYLNISRTTLSLGGSGFIELLKNKFEVDYRQPVQVPDTGNQSRGLFGFMRK